MRLSKQTYLLAGVCLLDLITTLWFLRVHGAAEANQVMGFFLKRGTHAFILAKLAFTVIPLALLEWARRRRPIFVSRATALALVAYVVLYVAGVARANFVPDLEGVSVEAPERRALWEQLQKAMAEQRAGGVAPTGYMKPRPPIPVVD